MAQRRWMKVPHPERGFVRVPIDGIRRRSWIGKYWASLKRYIEGRGDERLQQFEGEAVVDAHGRRHEAVTDRQTINQLARRKQLPIDDIY
jgi:hypothetical protein